MNTAVCPSSRDLELSARNIHPGQWAVEESRPIATLLGSCVAVCLFDPKLHFGGINHFMLPLRTRSTDNEYDSLLRGDYAMEVLVNAMLGKGAQKQRMVAKAFGGGNVVSSLRKSIGDGNISFTKSWLEREGIPLVSSDFGGPWARKVIFAPNTGDAFCKRIVSTQAVSSQVVQDEVAYENSLLGPSKPREKKIELF
ncbi:MAG: chemotaxis protein CheD [Proteobacteria bacterium]|nr:chemotaxis protein CheD [Pseudomonadota bacterium]